MKGILLRILSISYIIKGYSKDERGYWKDRNGNLVHRNVAYKKYNPRIHPMPFSKYVIHHKDLNKENNRSKNLAILTKEEHKYVRSYRR
jgi:hypothetical protein